jgi:beta-lactamase superfamily II metal-dependent hydrolase
MQGRKTTKNDAKNKSIFSVIVLALFALFILINVLADWNEAYSFFGLSGGKFDSAEGVSVHFIDVGQGDSALILTPENSILIDSGEREYAPAVLNYLKTQGVKKLDYIIASHPHSDHIGGMSEIINELGAERIIMPDVRDDMVPTTSAFLRLLDSIEAGGVEVIFAKSGINFNLDNGAKLEIIAPLNDYDKMNNYSIVAKFTHQHGTFLFTGDIESAAEDDIADSGIDISADVLKVAHHGSATSSKAKFLNAVGGRFAVIGVGSPNSYNHPRDEVLNRLRNRNYEILRTDLHGNIVFDVTADGLVVYVQKGD